MKRGAVTAIAAAAAAVLIAGGVALWLLTRPSTPDDTVAEYLDALSGGDGPRAAALLAEAGDADRLAVALTGAARLISDPRVNAVDTDGAQATAAVSFELSGEDRTARLSLVRRDDRWLVGADGVGELTATAPLGGGVLVGDVTLELGVAQSLLPAEYDVRAAPAAVVVGTALAVVLPGEALSVDVVTSLSPDATGIAQEQLDAYQDACTRPAAAVPRNCGLRVPWAADLVTLQTLAWRIDQRPTLTLSPDGATFAATGGIVVATATGITPGGETAGFTYRADDWALRGRVSFTADAMTLAVD